MFKVCFISSPSASSVSVFGIFDTLFIIIFTWESRSLGKESPPKKPFFWALHKLHSPRSQKPCGRAWKSWYPLLDTHWCISAQTPEMKLALFVKLHLIISAWYQQDGLKRKAILHIFTWSFGKKWIKSSMQHIVDWTFIRKKSPLSVCDSAELYQIR